ncbi:YcxB family protein [Acidovorax cavernicola]|uniref:YcxB family protein n=1 Tax=Acidovorax cavernicola TaxID=1675792 RepID=A0A9X8CZD7_9BURK|nr:YcxB family protein [Acidovorax cavernicola]RIX73938.1 YcxB family protein [Acidovorax cavernicola]
MQITYRFQFSEDHLLTGFLRNLQQIWWVRLKWPLALLFGVPLVVCVYEGFLALAAVFALGIVLVLSAPAIARLALHRFRQSPFYDQEIDLSLSESGTHARGPHSEERHGWEAYTKACRFKDGLLLFHGPDAFRWLPDTAAADAASIAAAQQLVRAHIRDYRDL